jgi:hypothetical protein
MGVRYGEEIATAMGGKHTGVRYASCKGNHVSGAPTQVQRSLSRIHGSHRAMEVANV